MQKKIHFLFIVWLCAAAVAFAQTKKPIVAGDLMKIATTSSIQISPDGTNAITVVVRKAMKNENDYYYTRHLYLLDLVNKPSPFNSPLVTRMIHNHNGRPMENKFYSCVPMATSHNYGFFHSVVARLM